MDRQDQRDTSSESDLDLDEKDLFLPSDIRRQQHSRWSLRWFITTLALILTVMVTTILYHAVRSYRTPAGDPLNPPDKYKGQWTNCGPSIETALERGCVFDVGLTVCWLVQCHSLSSTQNDTGPRLLES